MYGGAPEFGVQDSSNDHTIDFRVVTPSNDPFRFKHTKTGKIGHLDYDGINGEKFSLQTNVERYGPTVYVKGYVVCASRP